MTPLLGTKNPSAPVGDKSGGGRRAARAVAFQVFTNHETRITAFYRVLRPWGGEKCRLSASVGRPAGFKGGCTKRCVNEWKGVYLNPERKITTFSESRFGSRFGIRHNSSQFVGKIRISPCRQSSALEHCGNRDIDFLDASRPRLTFPGPQVSPSGEAKDERITNHGFFRRRCARDAQQETPARTAAPAARPLLSCALWRGMGRLWRGMGGRRPPRRQHGLLSFHQPRITQHGSSPVLRRLQGEQPQARPTGFHESRDTAFTLFFPRFPGISRYFPAPPTPPVKGPRAVRIGNTAGRVFCETRITNHGL